MASSIKLYYGNSGTNATGEVDGTLGVDLSHAATSAYPIMKQSMGGAWTSYTVGSTGTAGNFGYATTKTLRNVATRCRHNNGAFTGSQSLMNLTGHTNQGSAVSALQVVWGHWYATANGEFNGPAGATITASIEYPVGTLTQLLFSGNATGTLVPGANLVSDSVTLPSTMPRGAIFNVRSFITCAAGGLMTCAGTTSTTSIGAPFRDACLTTATVAAGVDLTMSASLPTNSPPATGTAMFPLAILGMSNVPSVMAIGDSRCAGTGDNALLDTGYGGTGEVCRSLGYRLPYCNQGCGSDRARTFLSPATGQATSAMRLSSMQYHTHCVVQYGTNDLTADSASAVTLLGYYSAIYAQVGAITGAAGVPLKVSQVTITPVTTSSDAWASVANQTVAPSNAVRESVNATLRTAPPAALWTVHDNALATEQASTGVWQAVTGSTGITSVMTADGTHATPYGYQRITNAGGVDPSTFV